MPVQSPVQLRLAKALIFGPTKQGKTTFLGSAQLDERTAPMLLLDFEGGSGSLVGLDIAVFPVRSWKDYNEAFAEAQSPEYNSVGVDSISETNIFALLNILEVEGPSRKDPDALQQGDYGKALIQMRRLIREFRDLPKHVFATALATEELDAREGMVKKPAFSGSLRDEGPGLFDIVTYLALTQDEEGNTIRSLVLKNMARIRAGCRAGWGLTAPDYIDNPTITKLLDAFNYPKPTAGGQ